MISASKQKHIANVFAPNRVTRPCHIASNSRTLSLYSNFNLIVNFWEDMESAKESLNTDNVENMPQMCLLIFYKIFGMWATFKVVLNLLQYYFCSTFWF